MPPPQTAFPASELPTRVQRTAQNKVRKTKVELNDCELKHMVQYSCLMEEDDRPGRKSEVVCTPIVRLFRRYVMARTENRDAEVKERVSTRSEL